MARLILFLFFFGFSASLQAQLSDFGDAKSDELLLRQSESGYESDALILFEAGEMYFTENLDLALTYHIRIKLFNEEAFDYGTHRITYNPRVRQSVVNLRASVHRFNEKSRTVADFVPDSLFQIQDIENGLKEIRFTIPNLKPGSVIEYTYTKIFGHPANIPDWIIQRDIPVLYNSLLFWDDKYFEFDISARGAIAIDQTQETIFSDYEFGSGIRHEWNSEDVPALSKPEFLHQRENFRSRIEFRLSSINIDYQFQEDLSKTWGEIHDDLQADYYFAGQLLSNDEIRAISDKIRSESSSSMKAIQAVYDLVADTALWNGKYTIKAEHPITETLNGVPSSSAAINLLLTRMLRNIEIQADPVLISTRENGFMYLDIIDTDQFNHLIVKISMDDEVYFLDASQGKSPVVLSPLNDLNKAGLQFTADTLKWIDIESYGNSDIQISVTGEMNENGTITGQLSGKVSGYYTQDTSLNEEKVSEWFMGYAEPTSSITFTEPLTTTYSQVKNPVISFRSDSIRVLPEESEKDDYTFMFNPLMAFRQIENPFTDTLRIFPVEFDFPYSRIFNADIRLPEGYKIAELPEPVTARLPSGKGRLLIVIQQVGDRLSYLMQFDINDDFFSVQEYPALREIFRLAEEARNTSIDLVKIR